MGKHKTVFRRLAVLCLLLTILLPVSAAGQEGKTTAIPADYRMGSEPEQVGAFPLQQVSATGVEERALLNFLNRIPGYVTLMVTLVLLALLAVALVAFYTRVNSERRIRQVLYTDTLTGFHSERGFERDARRRLESSAPEVQWALVDFDINGFRTFNALHGYEEGNRLLCSVADALRVLARTDELFARISADHFVCLIHSTTTEQLRADLQQVLARLRHQPKYNHLHLSCGQYVVTDRSMDISAMRDKALAAKRLIKGRYDHQISVYDDVLERQLLEDAELLVSMDEALLTGQFVPYYQPKYSTWSEEMVGAEALVRWIRPGGEVRPPARFIDLFEKNGLVQKLDRYIFERTCQFQARRLTMGLPVVPISVNFSRLHLYDSNLANELRAVADRYQVSPELLEVEMTESAFLENTDVLLRTLATLRKQGFRTSIDDFGSGFSSLNMLKDAPVDALKIDLKFMQGFEEGNRAGTVVAAVMRMAKWLGLSVVAEGVETRAQAEYLRSIGCDAVQGYYYGRPMNEERFTQRLDVWHYHPADAENRFVGLDDVNLLMGGNALVSKILESSFDALSVYEFIDGRLEAVRVSNTYHEMMGYDSTSFSRQSYDVLCQVHEEDRRILLEVCYRAQCSDALESCQIRRYHNDGHLLELEINIRYLGGTINHPMFLFTFVNQADRLRTEREKQFFRYAQALYSVYDAIYMVDRVADTVASLHGDSQQEIRKEGCAKIVSDWIQTRVHPADYGKVSAFYESAGSSEGNGAKTLEYRIQTEAELRWHSTTCLQINQGRFLLCVMDITERRRANQLLEENQRLRHSAEIDALTGLYNRTAATERIDQSLAQMLPGSGCALMVMDIDDFKSVNDTLGHLMGDAFLRDVATVMMRLFREKDVVSRYGGDEFVIYMSGPLAVSDAERKAAQLVAAVNDIVVPELGSVRCSVGVTHVAGTGAERYNTLFRQADAALYLAKYSGKNHHVLYEETFGDTNVSKSRLAQSLLQTTEMSSQVDVAGAQLLVGKVFRTLYHGIDTRQAADAVLRMVGEYFQLSRVYIFEDASDGRVCSNTFAWCNEGIQPAKHNRQDFDCQQAEAGVFYCRDVKELPAVQRGFLESQGIKSLLQCAILSGDEQVGFVGFDECRENCCWTKVQVDTLVTVAEHLAVFLVKNRLSQQVEQAGQGKEC